MPSGRRRSSNRSKIRGDPRRPAAERSACLLLVADGQVTFRGEFFSDRYTDLKEGHFAIAHWEFVTTVLIPVLGGLPYRLVRL